MLRSKAFRKLIEGKEMIVRPCAYDALSAVLIERAGFAVVGTSGYAISASIIGQPDIGLVSFGEMLERVRTITNSVSVPVDADRSKISNAKGFFVRDATRQSDLRFIALRDQKKAIYQLSETKTYERKLR